jgi:cytochrome c553
MLIISTGALAAAEAPVAGDPAAGKTKSATCGACHGADGNSTDPQYPKLAQQHAGYTAKQLKEYHGGDRENAVMSGMAQPLSEQDILDLASYFETQTIVGGAAEEEQVVKGEQLYRGGDLSRGIAACSACHGPAGRGNPAAGFPSLAGQHAQYTEGQLMAFRSLQRHNDAGQMMRNIAGRLSDQDMKAVASYIAGLRE